MKLWTVSENYGINDERELWVRDEDTDGVVRWYWNGTHLPADSDLIPEGFGDAEGRHFATAVDFYEAEPRRLRSPERDYGVMWRQGGASWVAYRVSYVFTTGELYAVTLGGSAAGRVELLASFGLVECGECDGSGAPQDPFDAICRACGGTGSSTDLVERALDGWEDVCGTPGSLEWLRDQLAEFQAAA